MDKLILFRDLFTSLKQPEADRISAQIWSLVSVEKLFFCAGAYAVQNGRLDHLDHCDAINTTMKQIINDRKKKMERKDKAQHKSFSASASAASVAKLKNGNTPSLPVIRQVPSPTSLIFLLCVAVSSHGPMPFEQKNSLSDLSSPIIKIIGSFFKARDLFRFERLNRFFFVSLRNPSPLRLINLDLRIPSNRKHFDRYFARYRMVTDCEILFDNRLRCEVNFDQIHRCFPRIEKMHLRFETNEDTLFQITKTMFFEEISEFFVEPKTIHSLKKFTELKYLQLHNWDLREIDEEFDYEEVADQCAVVAIHSFR